MTGAPAPGEGAAAAVATELRRRRRLLHISQAEAARRSGVGRTVINEIERGRRVPSLRTYERLRTGLGLDLAAAALVAPAPPPPLHDHHLARLAACLVARRHVGLHELAAALGVSLPAVREGLSVLGERLAGVGMRAVVDGLAVELCPLPLTVEALQRLAVLEEQRALTAEQLEVIAILAARGPATRADIQRLRRGPDSESVLRGLLRRGLVATVGDAATPGAPHVYRLTSRAVAMCGHASVEALQAQVLALLEATDAVAAAAGAAPPGPAASAAAPARGPALPSPAPPPGAGRRGPDSPAGAERTPERGR